MPVFASASLTPRGKGEGVEKCYFRNLKRDVIVRGRRARRRAVCTDETERKKKRIQKTRANEM